jgi:hypothetical protein
MKNSCSGRAAATVARSGAAPKARWRGVVKGVASIEMA